MHMSGSILFLLIKNDEEKYGSEYETINGK